MNGALISGMDQACYKDNASMENPWMLYKGILCFMLLLDGHFHQNSLAFCTFCTLFGEFSWINISGMDGQLSRI